MKEKKIKIWKKVLIVIAIIFTVYLAITLYKYSVLTKMYERNTASNNMQNRYYYSETDDQITEFWQKDGLMKNHLKRKENIGDIIMWEDTNTGEKYIFWNEPKKIYQEGGQIVSNCASMFMCEESKIRLMMAAHPFLFIFPKNYNEKECYCITMSGNTEIIEKETGLTVYCNNNGEERTISYTFNNVTDEEAIRPDLNEYKLQE